MKAIINIGMPASGKDIGKQFAKENGILFFATGDVVRSVCVERDLEPDATNCTAISNELRGMGPTTLTKIVMKKVLDSGKDIAIIEGMRSIEEIELLKIELDIKVCAFVVGKDIRKKRYFSRKRADDDPNMFDARDRREVDYGVGKAIALADFYILNESTIEEASEVYAEICMGFIND